MASSSLARLEDLSRCSHKVPFSHCHICWQLSQCRFWWPSAALLTPPGPIRVGGGWVDSHLARLTLHSVPSMGPWVGRNYINQESNPQCCERVAPPPHDSTPDISDHHQSRVHQCRSSGLTKLPVHGNICNMPVHKNCRLLACRFATFALPWIKNQELCRVDNKSVALPASLLDLYVQVNRLHIQEGVWQQVVSNAAVTAK